MRARPISALALPILLAAASDAHATHVLFQNVQVNGVPLDSASGFTNPTIFIADIGDVFTVSYDIFATLGIATDSLDVTFSGSGLADPASSSIAFVVVSGPDSFSFTRSFTTNGIWTGTMLF